MHSNYLACTLCCRFIQSFNLRYNRNKTRYMLHLTITDKALDHIQGSQYGKYMDVKCPLSSTLHLATSNSLPPLERRHHCSP